MSEILRVALEAVKKGCEIAIKVRESGNLGLNFKGEANLCTIADIEAEKAIISIIRHNYPNHFIISEETNSELEKRDYTKPHWIIDPIDGTTNYAHGHNHVGVSVAFFDKGHVQCGVVGVPFQDEVFHAVRGQGAFVNGNRITCGVADNLRSALVCTGFPYVRTEIGKLMQRFQTMLKDCRDIRRLGACSVDVCWVACGRLDIYYEDVMPWDMAAAGLIAREAGAVTDHFNAEPAIKLPKDLRSDGFIVCNEKLMGIVSKLLV